ncbi:PaaI family thioesterase [Gordonia rubripertincta]|uniref:PaaI family thioesterase n=1 Tax=Gordonia rubripertincta TaxID=36822 RepID=A0ABT4MVP6_GORRU|nr:PaaI family thioesterase [Gordonia rubripertincta]MCZ4551082.1 PaaI family thioesterase [Gordonia rubripertincta]
MEPSPSATPPPHQPMPDDESSEAWVSWANAQPAMGTLGLTCTSVDPEESVFALGLSAFPINPNRSVHGGQISAATDQVMAVVAARASAAGLIPVTSSLHVQFHAPAFLPITIRGRLLPSGFRIKYVEVVVTDAAGDRCATGHGTMVGASVERRLPGSTA